MGRIRANSHRRALVCVFAVAALALAACIPSNPPRPPVPPEAAFSVSTAPLVASFTDESTGVINSRSWDFGAGETSTEQRPTHTYATHGVYAVSLTVTGPGGTDTATQDVTVNPPAPFGLIHGRTALGNGAADRVPREHVDRGHRLGRLGPQQ